MLSLLWLLLPVAAASGWYAAKRSQPEPKKTTSYSLSPKYYQGLNYLIDEQPDKAIQVFCQIVEANDEKALDLHLALGNLFRRRGEVDRAIHIHQSLLSNSNINPEFQYIVTIELAHDYLKAGLLDRAETLLLDLLDNNVANPTVLKLLQAIYQQEKEWSRAIEAALKNNDIDAQQKKVIAHYYCEMALEDAKARNPSLALEKLEHALNYDKTCARANIIKGNIHKQNDDYLKAYNAYKSVARQNFAYSGEVVQDMLDCSYHLNKTAEFMQCLRRNIKKCPDVRSVEAFLVLLKESKSDDQATIFLINSLKQSPSLPMLQQLLHVHAKDVQGELKDTYRLASDTLHEVLKQRPSYLCESCGFSGRTLHWLCPSCKAWGSTIPVCSVNGKSLDRHPMA